MYSSKASFNMFVILSQHKTSSSNEPTSLLSTQHSTNPLIDQHQAAKLAIMN